MQHWKLCIFVALLFSCATIAARNYDRSDWEHWIDEDGDCQDTRQELLIEASRSPVRLDESGCRVLSGEWFAPYLRQSFTNPSGLDIDHIVPLSEAHRSGGALWSPEEKRRFANDPFNLQVTSASFNRSKGGRTPAEVLPIHNTCFYVTRWVAVKIKYSLTMVPDEIDAVCGVPSCALPMCD